LNITANGLSAKEILPSIEIPSGTDKEYTVNNMPDLDVLNYMEAGNVVMTFQAETNTNHTKAATIQVVPTVDVLGLSKFF
jgi:5-methylcytosine-specific restriction endonuclease McrBC GTP-binding regulatory subunit McrB